MRIMLLAKNSTLPFHARGGDITVALMDGGLPLKKGGELASLACLVDNDGSLSKC